MWAAERTTPVRSLNGWSDLARNPLILTDEDCEQTVRLFEMLPGLSLGLNTNVAFRLTMPGRVTATDAHRRDGHTLEWKFEPLDEPVEVCAKSELGG